MVLPFYSVFFSIVHLFHYWRCSRCCDGSAANGVQDEAVGPTAAAAPIAEPTVEEAAPIGDPTVASVGAHDPSNDPQGAGATEVVQGAGEGERKQDDRN